MCILAREYGFSGRTGKLDMWFSNLSMSFCSEGDLRTFGGVLRKIRELPLWNLQKTGM